MSDGKDLRVFIDSLIKNFRDMLICKITEDSSAMLDYNAEDMVKLKALSDKMSFEKISHATSVLSDAQADTKWMKSPRIVYELALIKLARPEYDDSPSAVMDRLASLESKVKNGAVTDTSSLSERISNLEEKVKNGITVQPTETVKKKEVPRRRKLRSDYITQFRKKNSPPTILLSRLQRIGTTYRERCATRQVT